MMIRITLIAKEKSIGLSIAAFKSTGLIPLSRDISHSTCYISALANSITGGIPSCSSESKPQRGSPKKWASGIAIGGILALQVGIPDFAFLSSTPNKTQEANTYQVSASDYAINYINQGTLTTFN